MPRTDVRTRERRALPRKHDPEPVPDRNTDVADLVRVRRTQLRVPDGISYSQLSLAARVGASKNTYYAIENGELRHRDPAMLDAIARELGLSPGERRSLYLIFNGHEPQPLPGLFPPDCVDDHAALIKDLPHPAYITDMRWNVLARNDTLRREAPAFNGTNVFEWILSDETARQMLVSWYDVWAVRTLRCLKTLAAVTGDPFLVDLYKKLHRLVDRADEVIGYFDPSGEIRSFIRPDGTQMTFRYQIYRLLSDQPSPYRIVNLIPTNDSPVHVSDTARMKSRELDRKLRGGAWKIPERE